MDLICYRKRKETPTAKKKAHMKKLKKAKGRFE